MLIFLIYKFFSYSEIYSKPNKKYNLINNGFTIHKNILSLNEIDDLKELSNKEEYKKLKQKLINNPNIKELIKKSTNNDSYVFQDYIFIIKRSSIHTCHRDYNGDFFNEGQKHPSYTVLIYLEDMEKCLGVIPNSHKNVNSNNINITNPILNLLCNKGDIIIFNANLIHVGMLNEKEDNLRIQMKITHKKDLKSLSYYQNYNKILNETTHIPKFIRKGQQNLSCMFPGISNMTQKENIQNVGKNSPFQKLFAFVFYGNSNFYTLPNAI